MSIRTKFNKYAFGFDIKRQENVPHFYKWRVPLLFSGGENISRLAYTPMNVIARK